MVTPAVPAVAGIPVTAWGCEPAGLLRRRSMPWAMGAGWPDPDNTSPRKAVERRIAATFSTEREIAAYLDSLRSRPTVR